MRKPQRSPRAAILLAAACLLVTSSCAADRASRCDEAVVESEAPTYRSRTGVPILMDIPIIGFFFGKTTTSR